MLKKVSVVIGLKACGFARAGLSVFSCGEHFISRGNKQEYFRSTRFHIDCDPNVSRENSCHTFVDSSFRENISCVSILRPTPVFLNNRTSKLLARY